MDGEPLTNNAAEYEQDAIENEQAADSVEPAEELTEEEFRQLDRDPYSKAALVQALRGYGATPEIIATWSRTWEGHDLTGWIIRASEAICYTPQAAEEVRALVLAGTPEREYTDGFLYKVATGQFELRSPEATFSYLRTAFRQKNQDRRRKETYQRTRRSLDIPDLCRQINTKYGTSLETQRDLEKFLETVKKLGWDIQIGRESIRLEDIRLNGPSTTVVTREKLGHVPSEIEGDEPDLAPEDTGGKKTQGDFSAQYDSEGQPERRQRVWNGNDRVAEAAIREIYYEKIGRQASTGTPAAASGNAVQKWLGKVILGGSYDDAAASLLHCNPRHIRRLRKRFRLAWRRDWN